MKSNMEVCMKVNEFEVARLSAGHTKNSLAKASGVARSTIENWYNGNGANPKNAKKVAETLGVKFEEVFGIRML